jgi:hypothetical protein
MTGVAKDVATETPSGMTLLVDGRFWLEDTDGIDFGVLHFVTVVVVLRVVAEDGVSLSTSLLLMVLTVLHGSSFCEGWFAHICLVFHEQQGPQTYHKFFLWQKSAFRAEHRKSGSCSTHNGLLK